MKVGASSVTSVVMSGVRAESPAKRRRLSRKTSAEEMQLLTSSSPVARDASVSERAAKARRLGEVEEEDVEEVTMDSLGSALSREGVESSAGGGDAGGAREQHAAAAAARVADPNHTQFLERHAAVRSRGQRRRTRHSDSDGEEACIGNRMSSKKKVKEEQTCIFVKV